MLEAQSINFAKNVIYFDTFFAQSINFDIEIR